jgi:hypothetical protein
LTLSEEEHQRRIEDFTKRLKDYPQVGKRPFGYPKGAWLMSGMMGTLGLLLLLPLVLSNEMDRASVLCPVVGVLLFCCGFTMRVVAFTSAASGAMDRWLYERLEAVDKTSSP